MFAFELSCLFLPTDFNKNVTVLIVRNQFPIRLSNANLPVIFQLNKVCSRKSF